MHQRSQHQDRYPIKALCKTTPALQAFVKLDKDGNETIDFHNPDAVKVLNTALLRYFYKLQTWDIPEGFLVPGVPGRADYVHYAADLLSINGKLKKQNIAHGSKIVCLDIGVGANCIYPIIGRHEYGWTFIGSEIDDIALSSAENLIQNNELLRDKVELRKQTDKDSIISNIIKADEYIDLVICNPPFHHSAKAAKEANRNKTKNIAKEKNGSKMLNFGGHAAELWCKDGEEGFLKRMILESQKIKTSVHWFTILLSKEKSMHLGMSILDQIEGVNKKVIPIERGNKKTRILAWSFLNKKQRQAWIEVRWK